MRLGSRHGSGVLKRGFLADLIAISGEPTEDIDVLARELPLLVMKNGKVVAGRMRDGLPVRVL